MSESDLDPRSPEGDGQIGPDLRRALAADEAPKPDAASRARLRERFLAEPFSNADVDAVEGPDLGPPPVVEEPWRPARLSHPGGEAPSTGSSEGPAPRSASAGRLRTLAALLAIAAAVVLMFRWPDEHGWRVLPNSEFVLVKIDGKSFHAADAKRLAAELGRGSTIEVEGGVLGIVLDQRLALALGDGAKLTLTAMPERDVVLPFELDHARGSLAVATGPEFTGSSLEITTPDSRVRVVGTRFAVDIHGETGSCLCCEEGRVEVRDAPPAPVAPELEPAANDAAAEGEAQGVEGGSMDFRYRDRRPPLTGAAMPEHLALLRELDAAFER